MDHRRDHARRRREKIFKGVVTNSADLKVHYVRVNRFFGQRTSEVKDAINIANSELTIHLHEKICVIYDQNEQEVIGIIQFLPFREMSNKKFKELEEISKYLAEERRFCQEIMGNAFQRSGHMYALGWTAAFHKKYFYATYLPPLHIRDDPIACKELMARLPFREDIENFYISEFGSLSKHFLKIQQEQTRELKVPTLGQLTENKEDDKTGLGSNLTFTFESFSNVPHQDHDVSKTTFFLSVPVFNNGKLACHSEGFDVINGRLLFNDWGIAADLGSCDGAVTVIYFGNKDRHCTLPSQEPSGRFTGLSSSVQISKRLFERVTAYATPESQLGKGKSVASPENLVLEYSKDLVQCFSDFNIIV
ncbi:uncharacterized protein MELLADRAFT_63665 [Melampsora larici-populina 98AG31]|uniref:Tet-like 2OG-Fe(II) oxygenase domain-containing protein n=1 Tax=Melampsora larici-populina (strain 98AG31 / pathotype 3-4-7) TaxID=747676 RepID=F4RNI7_MELLP|nr:uncharacterized protein MELLADRAFT_63665 [Melampsora larici-populina 98AG31]EGG05994.1 hypothetical protein MELLADRAFT_63665 [Melampsora larici-populina 98AG31]